MGVNNYDIQGNDHNKKVSGRIIFPMPSYFRRKSYDIQSKLDGRLELFKENFGDALKLIVEKEFAFGKFSHYLREEEELMTGVPLDKLDVLQHEIHDSDDNTDLCIVRESYPIYGYRIQRFKVSPTYGNLYHLENNVPIESCLSSDYPDNDNFISNTEVAKNNDSYRAHVEKIIEKFSNVDNNKKWEYCFRSKEHMYLLSDILAKYFNQITYDIPNEVLNLQQKCKTKLSIAIREIYELKESNICLKNDDGFFNILKKLSVYKDLSNDEIYKALTK